MIKLNPLWIDSSSLNLVERTRYNVFAKIILAVTSLVVNGFASRSLGVDLFGDSQYIIWIVQTVWLAGNLGLPQMYTRFLALDAKTYSHRLLFHWPALWILLLTVILTVISIQFVEYPIRILVALLTLSISSQLLLQSISDGLMHNNFHFYATIWSCLAMLGTAFFAVPQIGLQGYLLALLVQSSIYACIMAFLLGKKMLPGRYSQNTQEETTTIFKYAFYAWLATVLSAFVWQRMELFFINRYLTKSDISYYSVGLTLSLFIMQPIVMLASALTPHFTRISQENRSETQQTYVLLTKAFAWATFLLGWFVAFNSKFFLGIIYGEKFITGSSVAFWLLIFSPLSAIASVGSALVYGHGKARFVALSSSFGALAAPLVFLLVIPAYGIVGAAIARGMMQTALIAAGSLYITYFLRYPFPLRSYLFCMVVASFAAALSQWIFPQQEFVYIVIKGILVLVMYTLFTNNNFVFTAQERTNVSSIIKSVFS
jgi:O-antigen/teichoic acid export membrane protein